MIFGYVYFVPLRRRRWSHAGSGWFISIRDENGVLSQIGKPSNGKPVRPWARRIAKKENCSVIVYRMPGRGRNR